MPAKRVVRGKFEAWFFVEFWKALVRQLQDLAREAGGKVDIRVRIEHGTFVTGVKSYVEPPHSLHLFLRAHFPDSAEGPASASPVKRSKWRWLGKVFGYQRGP